MEKLAVVTQDDEEKTAADGCPKCGKEVEVVGNVKRCAVTGSTKPFEKDENHGT